MQVPSIYRQHQRAMDDHGEESKLADKRGNFFILTSWPYTMLLTLAHLAQPSYDMTWAFALAAAYSAVGMLILWRSRWRCDRSAATLIAHAQVATKPYVAEHLTKMEYTITSGRHHWIAMLLIMLRVCFAIDVFWIFVLNSKLTP